MIKYLFNSLVTYLKTSTRFPTRPSKMVVKGEVRPYDDFVKLIQCYNTDDHPPEVLLLGDSVAERISKNDLDERPLAQIITSNLKDKLRVACVSHSAFQMKVFYNLLLAVNKMKQKPRVVVLPINTRSFSPQWELEPTYQFNRLISLIEEFISNPKSIPPYISEEIFSPDLYEKFDSTAVDYPLSSFNRIGHFRLVIDAKPSTVEQKRFRLAQMFIFHYTFPLSPSHPRLMLLSSILELLNSVNISVVLYINPINIEAAEKYVGRAFSQSLKSNVQIISDLIQRHKATGNLFFKDCSTMLASNYFFHEDNATEHLNQEGRRELSSIISNAVLEIYNKSERGISD